MIAKHSGLELKQRIGALFYGERSIEMTTVVIIEETFRFLNHIYRMNRTGEC